MKCNNLLNFKDINITLKLQNWPVLIKYPTMIFDFKDIKHKDSDTFNGLLLDFSFFSGVDNS